MGQTSNGVKDAVIRQQEIIKDARAELVSKFSSLTKSEVQGITNRIELAQVRIKNLENGTLSPSAINSSFDPYKSK